MDPHLKAAIGLFTEFLDNLPLAVAIVDADGNYVYYNAESARQDDCLAERALGGPLLQVYPGMSPHSSTLLQAVRHGKRYHNQYQLYHNSQGKPVHQVHTTLPLSDAQGRVVGAAEIARDLSESNQLHERFVDLQQRLHARQARESEGILTGDPAMQKLLQQALRLAKTDVQVLIYGETGTGKELFARLLHRQSDRADQPYLVLNCAAIPEPLFESALFGTVKGAFTGAEDRAGLLESAHGGTLFLDELNSMPMPVQAKLLRALQEKTFRRVGASKEIRVDVRIIAATNESPQEMLARQRIREDLLYRLNVGYLAIPPLRERKQDIPLLAQDFLARHGRLTGHRVARISAAVLARLQRHRWPGNVRMLENVILRSLIFCEDGDELDFVLLEDDEQALEVPRALPAAAAAAAAPAEAGDTDCPLDEQVAAYERRLLVDYLRRYPNLSEAARRSGLPRATLQYKMKKYGIRLAQQVIDG
ncbi:sigma 54-interacting transcriptional regulator [Craterilacuibacter sp. RT1T]|uniref:sigma-54 interaction domain-containing protein n=1 Tax=Craterilacuibacter sp. RT1T TaxID=2942211 RepID=UPI0020BDB699|nr:sigma 54-interacting transcriptional regulator [Craterilacuibacter sp. RT1T]MCL6263626.1 sigma 54-interacting transcriptional regulator [Craterilacuibacter sp. RT1T]